MALVTLLVNLTPGGDNRPLLAAAAGLAARFGAHVEGIALYQPPPMTTGPIFLAAEGLAADRAERGADLAAAEAAFRSALRGQAASLGWFAGLTEAPLAAAVAACTRVADLVLVAADPPHSLGRVPSGLSLGDLVTEAGRPVLIVPADGAPLTLDHALIGWKDGRAARRALADSLPLLRKCRRITLCEIAPAADLAAAGERLAAVAAWLARHKIQAERRPLAAIGEDGPQLLATARTEQADLVIAGAYAHDRLREWIFGGVTRSLLGQHERCVLLSH
ncbi:hypothetical protein [Acidisoma sp. C75]